METTANIIIGFISVIHLYILWFEMFAWEKKGPKVFGAFPKDFFLKPTKAMAAKKIIFVPTIPALIGIGFVLLK